MSKRSTSGEARERRVGWMEASWVVAWVVSSWTEAERCPLPFAVPLAAPFAAIRLDVDGADELRAGSFPATFDPP
jgi:hypothetical protein